MTCKQGFSLGQLSMGQLSMGQLSKRLLRGIQQAKFTLEKVNLQVVSRVSSILFLKTLLKRSKTVL
jgi:hypothetical protein